MSSSRYAVVWVMGAISLALAAVSSAQPPAVDVAKDVLAELDAAQRMEPLVVRVVDEAGRPVTGAKVMPWALRSSQGHGWWRKSDNWAGVGPKEVVSDSAGSATVLYPYYRNLKEQTRTISVSLSVDHPNFAYNDDLHIDVPLESDEPHLIKLTGGVPLQVCPQVDGQPAGLENLFAFWSDGRSWKAGSSPRQLSEQVLEISAMPPGKNSVLLVRLDGERAMHFSRVTDLELKPGEPRQIDVPLEPAVHVRGVVSKNIPRPVRQGRIKAWTLDPADAPQDRAAWITWVPIEPDGSFSIQWPAGEMMQLIALCDGYIAANGTAPDVVKNPPDPVTDSFCRPQVFEPTEDETIELAMTPLARCIATAIDEDEQPVAGVTVTSWPNVGWWNGGSQIYGHPLVRGERLARVREYHQAIDEVLPAPFTAETDAQGEATLELPVGKERLAVISEVYELPVFVGHRDVRVELTTDQPAEATLRLQPRGTEKLGEWDKLAGVVFGCSTREGRRICALPSVQKQMEQFVKRFREGKNQRDPQLLSDAYSLVADAFAGVGDIEESTNWRQKAAEQAKLAASTGGQEGKEQ